MTQPFQGSDITPEDTPRLTLQIDTIRELMLDGKWRGLDEITNITGYPHSSISAQLRNLRKESRGKYIVNKKNEGNGYFLYQVLPPANDCDQEEVNPLMKLSKKELVERLESAENSKFNLIKQVRRFSRLANSVTSKFYIGQTAMRVRNVTINEAIWFQDEEVVAEIEAQRIEMIESKFALGDDEVVVKREDWFV